MSAQRGRQRDDDGGGVGWCNGGCRDCGGGQVAEEELMHQTTGAGGAALLNALIMVDLRACAFELLHRDAAADTAFGAEAALKATVRWG